MHVLMIAVDGRRGSGWSQQRIASECECVCVYEREEVLLWFGVTLRPNHTNR